MQYELTTLKDVFDKVPADRIETCLHELSVAMCEAKALSGAMDCVAKGRLGDGAECTLLWPDTSIWEDDGAGEITLNVVDKAGDNPLFSCKITVDYEAAK